MSLIPGNSYELYIRVIITVPVVAPLVVIPVLITITSFCSYIHKPHARVIYGTAKLFSFGNEKKIYLQSPSEKPSKSVVFLLVIKAILLLMFSLAVFLNESVIASNNGCVSGRWDCFARARGETVRVTNCSDLGEYSDDPIECYQPSFIFSTALSEVGGIAFLTQLIINAYIKVYFSIRHVRNRSLRIATASCVILLFFLVSSAGPIGFAVAHVIRRTSTLTFKMHNILSATYYSLLYFVVTLTMLLRSKCTFSDLPEYGSHTTVITVGGPMTGGDGMPVVVGGATTPPRASVQIAHGDKIHTINVV